jgi:thioredoxin reductase (NADPH)
MDIEDVIIIGGGPAGIAAAIQLKRYAMGALVFEREAIGGLLRNANLVENYPGFPGGISGLKLVSLLEQQARDFSLRVTFTEVVRLDFAAGSFQVETSQGVYAARIVVVASGTQPRPYTGADIPGEARSKVFYEIYPLIGQTGHEIVILGAGDAAFDYALNLAQSNQVVVLNRGEEIKCLPLLWERVQREPSISYYNNMAVSQIQFDPSTGMLLECSHPAGRKSFRADYLVVAFGRDARLDFLSGHCKEISEELESKGLLYLIGDVRNGLFRQTSIAVGDGVLVAMRIYKYFKENFQ